MWLLNVGGQISGWWLVVGKKLPDPKEVEGF